MCNLYNKSYNSVAEELGISRQSINGWVKGLRPIPKKHLPKLSKIFGGLYKEYFQKELMKIDKINIQKMKIINECRHLGLTLEEL
ncbi:helix-turn-helix domain-containing protein [Clostridium sp. ZBS18]|uniref:helix-turn-helix domain-containing protein n=1 Tax=Clostridium sp. ZBS18 TaxID=2949967 RepID=UPI00338DE1B4